MFLGLYRLQSNVLGKKEVYRIELEVTIEVKYCVEDRKTALTRLFQKHV